MIHEPSTLFLVSTSFKIIYRHNTTVLFMVTSRGLDSYVEYN